MKRAGGQDDRPFGRPPVPTESEEQKALFLWAAYNSGRHPELKWMYHVPNEGKRSVQRGAQMRAEGLKKGVPDVCLPVQRHGHGALYIEMKRVRGGRLTDEQKEWAEGLTRCGNLVRRCNGWEQAVEAIEDYLREGGGACDGQGAAERVQAAGGGRGGED